jgi:N-glycosylase/DNA lyase
MNTPIQLPAQGIRLDRTLLCGQAFRWKQEGDGFWGVAGEKPLHLCQQGGNLQLFCREEEATFWADYLSLDRDYAQLEEMLQKDPQAAPCLPYSRGIRVLRQQPYEALISFVISANNNVARISGIIERLCGAFGRSIEYQGRIFYGFPAPQRLAQASVEQLAELGAGYRAPYIKGCAQKIAEGYDLAALAALPFEEARRELMTFPGVGPKVAECVMLFALDFDKAFPVDVWVDRICKYLYPGETGRQAARAAAERFGPWAGAAQQYMFHYARSVGLGKNKKHP